MSLPLSFLGEVSQIAARHGLTEELIVEIQKKKGFWIIRCNGDARGVTLVSSSFGGGESVFRAWDSNDTPRPLEWPFFQMHNLKSFDWYLSQMSLPAEEPAQ
jgi:hypothetical protein